MERFKKSDVVLIGKINGSVEPVNSDKVKPFNPIHNSLFDLISCAIEKRKFKILVSSITHLKLSDKQSIELPLNGGLVEVRILPIMLSDIGENDCVIVRGCWSVQPDEENKYMCVVEATCIDKVDVSLILTDQYSRKKELGNENVSYLSND